VGAMAGEPTPYEIIVDSKLGEQEKFVRAWATEAVIAGMDKAGVEAADVAEGRMMVIEIRGKPFAYEGAVIVRHTGDTPSSATPFTCKCSSDELVAELTDEVAAVAGELVAKEEPGPVVAPTDGAAKTVPTTPAGPVDEPKRREGLGAMGHGGAAAIGIGAGAVIGGVVLLALGERSGRDDVDGGRDRTVNYRPAGGATLGVGVALVITGAVLVAVDKKRARKSARTTMTPTAGARTWGFAITGRF
jgi:hypothetical protein